jgi:hypothetical protein
MEWLSPKKGYAVRSGFAFLQLNTRLEGKGVTLALPEEWQTETAGYNKCL